VGLAPLHYVTAQEEERNMRPFFHHTSGSITFGLYDNQHYRSRWSWRVLIDWRDAADGITLIRPTITFVRGGR
jgi:hypothetical protein